MKLFNLILAFHIAFFSLSQSKKEQVEILTFRIDSINFVLNNTKNELVEKKKINDVKQNSIDSLYNAISNEKKANEDLKLQLSKQNTLLVYREKMISYLQKKVDSLNEVISQKYYLDNLPIGYKMTDINDQYGSECKGDFDSDGKEDLAIVLFNEENEGRVFIYLSSIFYTKGFYQSFSWLFNGNLLGDFECQDSSFYISGGSESQGIFQDVVLNYDRNEQKMVLKSYEDNIGGESIQIDFRKQ